MENIVAAKGKIVENWASTFSCSPELYVEPENVDQLKTVLAYAASNRNKVKVIGNRHSPSDIGMTSEIMVDLRRMNRVIQINAEKMLVTVESGILISDLNVVLTHNGMALSVLPSRSDFTVGGCISVAVHGSGIQFGTMSSFVIALELMAADGSLHFCSPEVNTDLFRAACCGLGAIGILTRVTLRCEPSFNLVQKQYGETLSETLEKLDYYLEKSDHFKFFWYPHTENTMVFLIDRYQGAEKAKRRKDVIKYPFWRTLLVKTWEKYILDSFLPVLTFYINYFAHWIHKSPIEFEDISYDVFNFDCLFKQYVNDWAIPIENTKDAIVDLKNWVDQANFTSTAHFPIEIRFVKADDSFLSPTAGRNSAYINIIMFRPYGKDIEKQKYWDAYEEIMERHGGRPHWAKVSLNPDQKTRSSKLIFQEHKLTAKKLRKIYPDFHTWCQVREKVDPSGIFLNSYLERILEV